MNCQCRTPLLLDFYRRYLDGTAEISSFIKEVRSVYSAGTLERLLASPSVEVRRAAVLALGQIGDFRSNKILAASLRDSDRTTAALAENALRSLWKRDENPEDQRNLQCFIDLLLCGEPLKVVTYASLQIEKTPRFAEVWNVRGQAWFDAGKYAYALEDFRRALALNPYHFNAAVMMGYAHMELGHTLEALRAFRLALELNPGLKHTRSHMKKLQRSMQTDG